MPNLWDKTFAKLLESGSLVEIYRHHSDGSSFGLGRLLGVSEEYVSFATVDLIGAFDGFSVLKREEVAHLEWGSTYDTDREFKAQQTFPRNPPACLVGAPQLAPVLEECRLSGCLCEFGYEKRYRGRVLEFDDDCAVLELYNEDKATMDGFCLLPLGELQYLEFQSQTLQRQEAVLRKLWGL